MITLHTGKLGVGKSYWATREVWKNVVRGRDCYVNWRINFDNYWHFRTTGLRGLLWYLWIKLTFANQKFGRVFYWETLDDLYTLRNGEVFFDEAHMALDSRDFAKLPRSFKVKLTQSRKYGLNLHFITQHQGQIDIVIRRLANDIVEHKKIWRIFFWREWDGQHIETLMNPALPAPRSSGFGLFIFSKKLASCYDTFAFFDQFAPFEGQPMWSVNTYLETNKHRLKGGDKIVVHSKHNLTTRET